MKEGDFDDFMNQMDLGDPDPSNHSQGSVVQMILQTGFLMKKLMTGGNVIDYICIQTWDKQFQCVRIIMFINHLQIQ